MTGDLNRAAMVDKPAATVKGRTRPIRSGWTAHEVLDLSRCQMAVGIGGAPGGTSDAVVGSQGWPDQIDGSGTREPHRSSDP
jgi:hypothetical protein